MMIQNFVDLATHVGAHVNEGDTDEALCARIRKRVYKDTSCGCAVHFVENTAGYLSHVQVQGVCEGCDCFLPTYTLPIPFTADQWDAALSQADSDGCSMWDQTHGCEGCGEPDTESGYRRVNPDCPNCGGTGVVM